MRLIWRNYKKVIAIVVAIVSILSLTISATYSIPESAYELPTYNATKTPAGLAEWAIAAYNGGLGYAKGYYCQSANTDNFQIYAELYTDWYIDTLYYGESYCDVLVSYFANEYNPRLSDCVGLIKGYMWSSPDYSFSVDYDFYPDLTATDLFDHCTVKGDISSMPDVAGTIVYDANTPHVGVYIGDGKVVDCRTPEQGTVLSNVSDYTWTNWMQLPELEYPEISSDTNNSVANQFAEQLDSVNTLLGILPSDIQAAMVAILIFILGLAVLRIVL